MLYFNSLHRNVCQISRIDARTVQHKRITVFIQLL